MNRRLKDISLPLNTKNKFGRLQQTDIDEYILTEDFGGELSDVIKKYLRQEMSCIGSLSDHREVVTTWYDYLHIVVLRTAEEGNDEHT